jgi:GT2 family glycosyltransferase
VVPEPTIAAVVVSYNVRGELERCLRSLRAHGGSGLTAIAVVDNGSQDGTVEWLRADWPEVQTIDAGGNVGFARGNNLGIRATASELVLLLNPDAELQAGALPALVATLAAHPEAAAVGPRLVDDDGHPEISFGPMISPWGEYTQRRLLTAYERGAAWADARVRALTAAPGEKPWVSGACLLARRHDLEAAGLFDERYFLYTEDVDLCAAWRARGRTVRFEPAATVLHRRGRSGSAAPAATEAQRRISQLAFYRKHHPQWAPLLAWWLRRRGFDVR